ncbi:tetratricopeptide repeat protein [Streptomyces sviceus]|uniref:tetratricopeptide repeat protein n=1 Tax=Streptomyces sviceus TaxID=285530 RepID=UPI00368EE586
MGHHDEAIESLKIATHYTGKTRDLTGFIANLANLGLTFHRAGRPKESLEHLQEAAGLARSFLYHDDQLAQVLMCLGQVLKERGRLRAAHTVLSEAVSVFRQLVGDPRHLTQAQRSLGRLSRTLERRRRSRPFPCNQGVHTVHIRRG